MTTLIKAINILKNSILLKRASVKLFQFKTLTLQALVILQRLKFIDSFLVTSKKSLPTYCIIFFKFQTKLTYFQKIICISKPSKYITYSLNDLIKLRLFDISNDYVLSITTKKTNTLVTIDEAIRLHKGGLVLFKIHK